MTFHRFRGLSALPRGIIRQCLVHHEPVPSRLSCINPHRGLRILKDSKVDVRLVHSAQFRLESAVPAVMDIVRTKADSAYQLPPVPPFPPRIIPRTTTHTLLSGLVSNFPPLLPPPPLSAAPPPLLSLSCCPSGSFHLSCTHASLFTPPSSPRPDYFIIKYPVVPVYLVNYQIVWFSVDATHDTSNKIFFQCGVNITLLQTTEITFINNLFFPMSVQWFPHYIVGIPDTLGVSYNSQ